jgi:hypothetical protein
MRRGLITIETSVTGVAAVVGSILLFFLGLSVYSRYVFSQRQLALSVGT